jgi:hypothetical protein
MEASELEYPKGGELFRSPVRKWSRIRQRAPKDLSAATSTVLPTSNTSGLVTTTGVVTAHPVESIFMEEIGSFETESNSNLFVVHCSSGELTRNTEEELRSGFWVYDPSSRQASMIFVNYVITADLADQAFGYPEDQIISTSGWHVPFHQWRSKKQPWGQKVISFFQEVFKPPIMTDRGYAVGFAKQGPLGHQISLKDAEGLALGALQKAEDRRKDAVQREAKFFEMLDESDEDTNK